MIRGFLHLSDRSPIPSLFFLTGELPIVARLHRDIFSLFYNIWINPQTRIYEITKYLLENCPLNSHTWARHIRNLAVIYNIEDPAILISQSPPSKTEFSNTIQTKIIVFHEKKLRTAALSNSKMSYLNVNVKGLNGRPHPALSGILTTKCVRKARAHIKMLTGDLYTYETKSKYQGGSPHCRLCIEQGPKTENLVHIITECKAYKDVRIRILLQIEIVCTRAQSNINFRNILTNNNQLTQFILDCTSLNLSERINECDAICPIVFNLARDLCYSIMKKRNEFIKS